MKVALLLMLCWTLLAFATSQDDDKTVPPELSAKGARRIRENLKVVEANLVDSQRNLTSSQKNLKVVQDELADLETLEKQHHALLSKYSAYVVKAESEMEKNEKEYNKVEADIKRLPPEDSAPKLSAKSQEPTEREKLLREKMDRESWKTDALAKIRKIHELEGKLQVSLKDIQSRREPLKTQLDTWTTRTKDYENLVKLLTQKKTELEKLAQK